MTSFVRGEDDMSLCVAYANEMKFGKPLISERIKGFGPGFGLHFLRLPPRPMLFAPHSLSAYKRKLWAWFWATFSLPATSCSPFAPPSIWV